MQPAEGVRRLLSCTMFGTLPLEIIVLFVRYSPIERGRDRPLEES